MKLLKPSWLCGEGEEATVATKIMESLLCKIKKYIQEIKMLFTYQGVLRKYVCV